jgi:hypothetical protein
MSDPLPATGAQMLKDCETAEARPRSDLLPGCMAKHVRQLLKCVELGQRMREAEAKARAAANARSTTTYEAVEARDAARAAWEQAQDAIMPMEPAKG